MLFREFLKDNIVFLDGGMGTLLQARGLRPGEHPERWNVSHPDVICDLQRQYYDAGSNVVSANTFGANSLQFSHEELEQVICAAFECVKAARSSSTTPQEKFVALDLGPTGRLLKPLGDLDFEEAVSIFAETVRLGVRYGADLILIETMNDSYETKAALLAAKENSDLPVLVSNAYGADGKLMTGASPAAMVAMLEGMGADAIGTNCSLGPKQLRPVVEELLACASVPVILKPNAGLPQSVDGKTVFDVTVDSFAAEVSDLVHRGVRVIGGCCGTTPEYIRALHDSVKDLPPCPVTSKKQTVISSFTHAVTFGPTPLLIGERINPTGKKRFKQALVEGDMDYILSEGVSQQEQGVHILDVNVGLPEIDEKTLLPETVCQLQAILDLPLQIDTSDPLAMEPALRRYNGKALVNSVSGKQASMEAIFPLVKKYGGVVVALTLDDDGIPADADGRVAIARKILDTAASYGIGPENLLFDPLAMTISADPQSAQVTLEALRRIRVELGCHTSLGVSNISFGLPSREAVNSTFFTMALHNGLSAAIMNPFSQDMRKAYFAYQALAGLDPNCQAYIQAATGFVSAAAAAPAPTATAAAAPEQLSSRLQHAIAKGLADRAGQVTAELLQTMDPLQIVNQEIIPALDVVGMQYERKELYLPQLLMSAEAAKSAFGRIKTHMASTGSSSAGRGPIVLATVHGDIHDIGKNIVKLLLENYGFAVTDLGRDVPPETIVETAIRLQAPLVGLSALMTTTVPAMEETIRQLKQQYPTCRTVVGGAVLTRDYAARIGADHYAKDAMETVRYAETLLGN
ncbi:MAG: homocysteine methyltransferase [Ruminococcaceae bacterium]|nr:homocysteine methyltransferase [Oscillospiraceae bacterium]